MARAREQRSALQHFSKNACRAPDIHLARVRLPGEHDLRRAIVPRRDVAGHLRFLQTGQAEIADFEVAVLVDENVAWLEVAMDEASRMDVFQSALCLLDLISSSLHSGLDTYQNLIEEILGEFICNGTFG